MTVSDNQLIELGPFTKGLNTFDSETVVDKASLREATNVDLDRAGGLARRAGYTRTLALTNSHSGVAFGSFLVCVEGSNLIRIDPGKATKTTIVSGGFSLAPVSYAEVPLYGLYYSDGQVSGRVKADWTSATWGIAVPPVPTVSAASGGQLFAGNYQVTITRLSADGEESGATNATLVPVIDGGRIYLSNLPTGYAKRIYISPPNGDELVWCTDVSSGVTSYYITQFIRSGRRLETQFCEPMPKGTIVRYYRGRLYVANSNVLSFSESLRYGLHRPLDGYFPAFPAPITVVEPVIDGLWVVADKTYFFGGQDPNEMQPMIVFPYGAVPHTGCQVPGRAFNLDTPTDVAYWFSNRGGVIGLPGGQFKPIHEARVDVPAYREGASLFYEANGLRQLRTALRNSGTSGRFGVQDSASATVVRNGIVIS